MCWGNWALTRARAEGSRRRHAQYPLGETPRTRHMPHTGCVACSRSTNSYAVTGSSWSPERELRRGFFQDLPLLAEDPVLTAQPSQFLLLVTGQPITALAFIQICLLEPQPEGLGGHAEILRNLRMGFPTRSGQPDRLGAKLRRIGLHMSR